MKNYYYKVIDKDEEELIEYCKVPLPKVENEHFYFVEISEDEYLNNITNSFGWFVPLPSVD